MIRHTAIARINILFGIGSEIFTVMPQLSAGALAGCGSAPAPQEDPASCACPTASVMGSQVRGSQTMGSVPALSGGTEGKSQGQMDELPCWAGLAAPQGWMPYICLRKALPKWITGTSFRYLNGKATIFCVHIRILAALAFSVRLLCRS